MGPQQRRGGGGAQGALRAGQSGGRYKGRKGVSFRVGRLHRAAVAAGGAGPRGAACSHSRDAPWHPSDFCCVPPPARQVRWGLPGRHRRRGRGRQRLAGDRGRGANHSMLQEQWKVRGASRGLGAGNAAWIDPLGDRWVRRREGERVESELAVQGAVCGPHRTRGCGAQCSDQRGEAGRAHSQCGWHGAAVGVERARGREAPPPQPPLVHNSHPAPRGRHAPEAPRRPLLLRQRPRGEL
mmetsp:Transcript_70878/g.224395  ORF Transcript_70878/g.224395 Transcript_70878/m.224395 type:complete len:239 (+) Transcript_70878:1468-2184(+)